MGEKFFDPESASDIEGLVDLVNEFTEKNASDVEIVLEICRVYRSDCVLAAVIFADKVIRKHHGL